jgi:hypothetical protein
MKKWEYQTALELFINTKLTFADIFFPVTLQGTT